MAGFGNIPSGLTIAASQAVRRNAANNAFEAFTPMTGITIGSTAISSGTNNKVLFQASGVVSQGNLEFSSSELKILNGTKHFELSLDSSYNAIFGHSFSASDNILQYQFKYYSAGGYATRGLKLSDVGNGYETVLNQTASGSLYITDNAGNPGALTLGTRSNPGDGSTFTAESTKWYLTGGTAGNRNRFGVNCNPGGNQLEVESSNSTFAAACFRGATSQTANLLELQNSAGTRLASFDASGNLDLADGKNLIFAATTGTKIGTASTQKIGFYGATPVTQRANIGEITDSTGGSRPATIAAFSASYTASELNDAFSTVIQRINRIEQVFQDLGITA